MIYNEYFGFLESPFSVTPNSRFFYTNGLYQEALANLRYGIEWRKGLVVMTGEVGTGKTTLLGKMMRSLAATTHPIFLSYGELTYTELLQIISRELGLACDGQDRLATVEKLREYLIKQHEENHIVALLIDEAQNLSDEMFEGIRVLSNFETENGKLLQILLTGQPELEARLGQPSLRHLKQRVVLHCRLAPLKNDEVGGYIDFRLQKAGYAGKELFNREAVGQISLYTGGIPRLINIVCDNALLLAYAGSKKQVSTEMVQEVARDLGLTHQPWVKSEASPSPVPGSDDGLWTTGSNGHKELAKQPLRQQKGGSAWLPIGSALVLVALGGFAGLLYSQQIKDYFQRASAIAARPQGLTHNVSLTDTLTQPRASAAPRGSADNPRVQPIKTQPIRPKAEQPHTRDYQIEMKKRESLLGTFEVVGPFSFVRGTPRSNAKIIATLHPPTQVKVVSVSGDYFRIQTSVEGRTIRGYVHREDAFFRRAKKAGQQKTRID
jgi:general secretion pathway protein A